MALIFLIIVLILTLILVILLFLNLVIPGFSLHHCYLLCLYE